MKTENCREWRESLGAHALGQLSPQEGAAIDAHVEGCPNCRAELEVLGSVARLLPFADPDRIESVSAPPADLADRVFGKIATERRRLRRRHWRIRVSLSGATAAVAAAALALFVLPGGGGGSGPEQYVAFRGLPPGVRISASLEPRAYGTEIRMYVKGVRSGTLCRVFLRGPNGTRLSAGSFRYRWGSDANAVLSSALDLSRTSAVGVRVGNRTFIAPVGVKTAFFQQTKQEATT